MEKIVIISNQKIKIENLKDSFIQNKNEASSFLLMYENLLKKTKIDISFNFNEKEIYLYKTLSNYLDESNLKYLSKFNLNLKNNNLNNKQLFKYFLLHIFYFFEKYNNEQNNKEEFSKIYNSINSLIVLFSNLYNSNFFHINHFEIFSRQLLLFSLIQIKEKKNKCDYIYEDNFIKNIMFIPLSFNIIKNIYINKKKNISKEEEISISNYFAFFDELILSNNISNLNLLQRYESKILNIIECLYLINSKSNELNRTLDNFISKLYILNFSMKGLMSQFLNITKNSLVNFNNNTLEEFNQKMIIDNFMINYFLNVFIKEQKLYSLDTYKLYEGFYLGSDNCGINARINKLNNRENTVLFSFNLIPIKNIENYTIIIFQKENNIYFSINLIKIKSSNNYELIIKINSNYFQPNIIIIPEQTYLFAISFFEKKKFIINYIGGQYKIKQKSNEYSYKDKIYLENFNLCIGCKLEYNTFSKENTYLYLNTFKGFVGPVIIFNKSYKIEKETMIDYIFKLKGKYGNFIYNNYNMKNILIFEENDYYYEKILKYFKSEENNIQKDIELYIYPESFKNKYIDHINYLYLNNGKEIYLTKIKEKNLNVDKKNNETKNLNLECDKVYIQENANFTHLKEVENNIQLEIPYNFNSKFFNFRNKSTFSEFLKMDGIKFLTLHLNFYYQIIIYFNKSKKEQKDNQSNKLIDSMYIFFIYFFSVQNIEIILVLIEELLNLITSRENNFKHFEFDLKKFFSEIAILIGLVKLF